MVKYMPSAGNEERAMQVVYMTSYFQCKVVRCACVLAHLLCQNVCLQLQLMSIARLQGQLHYASCVMHFFSKNSAAAGFPGEIMLRLLKMLVLPLVAGSMIAGWCILC